VLLHETAWGDGRRIAGRTLELADVAGFYAAFGFAPSSVEPDIPDHLCAELEFAGLLRIKEAWAIARGRRAQARIARDAARAFLADHLGRWVHALTHALTEYGAASPYREMGDLVALVVAAECRDRGARPESATGRLPFDTMQEESFACPLAANDAQPVTM
jgi:TorA maturation chaperone TorD